jgi:hypothetical protein
VAVPVNFRLVGDEASRIAAVREYSDADRPSRS